MRHGKRFNHLSRKAPHRKAMLSNMASSLILHKKIETTLAKAKALRKYVEPLLTKSKSDTTHSRRSVFSYLQNKDSLNELFNNISEKISTRPGGYTRIIKTGYRLGDNAEMCVIELVDYNSLLLVDEKEKKTKSRRRRRKKSSSSSANDSSKNVKVENKLIQQFNETFDTIFYISVLEHIENDKKEITDAIEKLEDKGHLIICVPAHNYMYSNFDKEIGHFRRYEMNFFDTLDLENADIKKKFFIDSFGHLLYFLNKILFSKEVYPSKLKVFIWDKIFIPITYIIDFLSFYKFGKNIICIIQKK